MGKSCTGKEKKLGNVAEGGLSQSPLALLQHMPTAETLGFSVGIKDVKVVIPERQGKKGIKKLNPLNEVLVGQLAFLFIKVKFQRPSCLGKD